MTVQKGRVAQTGREGGITFAFFVCGPEGRPGRCVAPWSLIWSCGGWGSGLDPLPVRGWLGLEGRVQPPPPRGLPPPKGPLLGLVTQIPLPRWGPGQGATWDRMRSSNGHPRTPLPDGGGPTLPFPVLPFPSPPARAHRSQSQARVRFGVPPP